MKLKSQDNQYLLLTQNSSPVLVAEIVAHFLPKMVELHNYSSASSQAQKLTNWDTLNSK